MSLSEIERVFRWCSKNRITAVKLSGGEPTTRHDLANILLMARQRSIEPTLCTNGIRLDELVMSALIASKAKVKISLHGIGTIHDGVLGRPCWGKVTGNINRLTSANVFTSVQTVVTRENVDTFPSVLHYCIGAGIPKISFIPFVPRGLGVLSRSRFELDEMKLEFVRKTVADLRVAHRNIIDVRLLDFWRKTYYVIDCDGKLTLQRETDSSDIHVGQLRTNLKYGKE